MNKVVKQGFKFLWSHFLGIILAFFCMMVFGWLIQWKGMQTFSYITVFLYLALLYSDAWNFGKLEGKVYNEIQETPLRALLASLIPVGLGLILFVFLLISPTWGNLVMRFYLTPFLGFFDEGVLIWWKALLCLLVLPVTVVIGYFFGEKQLSLLDKLMTKYNIRRKKSWKTQKEKENAERAEMIKKFKNQ